MTNQVGEMSHMMTEMNVDNATGSGVIYCVSMMALSQTRPQGGASFLWLSNRSKI
jgi:hypothetical protein